MSTKRERTEFGERLRQARTHAKLTQPQLAKAVGMAQSSLSELEWIGNGSSYTTQLAAACGVRVEWLAMGDEPMLVEPSHADPDVAQLVSDLTGLPEKWRKWALDAIQQTLEVAQEAAEIDAGKAQSRTDVSQKSSQRRRQA